MSTRRVNVWILAMATAVSCGVSTHASANDAPTAIVATGAPGTKEYAKQFGEWSAQWKKACDAGGVRLVSIGQSELAEDRPTDKQRLIDALKATPTRSAHPLWIVLLGHGTFDGRAAKFNLRGPDVSADELAEWLRGFERPVVVVNAASASAPFLKALTAPDRVVITATKSGYEQNYARFGGLFSDAIADPKSDLDKDGQTSMLEAFLVASRGVDAFYAAENRLATEHALLDDNGDGLGTRSDWFRGIRPVKRASKVAQPDGYRAHQLHLVPSEFERHLPADLRQRRDALELRVLQLRDAQDQMTEDAYLTRVEPLLIELAKVYAQAEASIGDKAR